MENAPSPLVSEVAKQRAIWLELVAGYEGHVEANPMRHGYLDHTAAGLPAKTQSFCNTNTSAAVATIKTSMTRLMRETRDVDEQRQRRDVRQVGERIDAGVAGRRLRYRRLRGETSGGD